MSHSRSIKDEARQMVEELPEGASWAYLARLVTARQLADESINGRESGKRQPNRWGMFWLSMGLVLFIAIGIALMGLIARWWQN